jgi:uncharacterized protein
MAKATLTAVAIALFLPAAAQAQWLQATPPETVVIAAEGNVETPPDTATLWLTMSGDGKTPDEATTDLAAKLKRVTAGLRGLDPAAEVRTNDVQLGEVYAGECSRGGYGPMRAMAAPVGDPCAVTGYRTSSNVNVRMRAVKDAGTAVGLAGRLGASQARIEGFTLADSTEAKRRAVAQAIAKARAEAEAIAAGSGLHVGAIVSVVDGNNQDIVVTGANMSRLAAPPPPVAPVRVDINPAPVRTNARLTVTFALTK